ncbi:hypothetical protein [Actinocrispum sp. NPDC049592]|uniref:hypothetical protein n=1 Tax=Actinocrispum sp. NPDC049592 TaxID=3154835 RepID=UPI003449C229
MREHAVEPATQAGQPTAATAAQPAMAAPVPDLLVLQRCAGNGAVTRMLARANGPAPDTPEPDTPVPPPVVRIQREPEDSTPEDKVKHALGSGSGKEVRKLGDPELATTNPAQRAGLAKILTDQLWTDKADEQCTMKLVRLKGEHAAVLAHLDGLGYRQKLLDSVDDEALHTELQGLLGATADGGTGPVAAALTSRKSEDVQRIPVTDLRSATKQQRTGLLQIMLDMWSSNAAEEGRMIDILEASGGDLAAMMADVKALGLKQRLFDHIDDDAAKQRLTALLKPLNDPELNKDLVVFNRGFWDNLGEGLKEGWNSAVRNFSLGGLIMGLLQPIIHPIDTIAKHINDAEQAIKQPSADRVVALLRDIFGTLGMWLLVAAGVVALVGVAVSAGVITLPAGIAIEGVAAALLTAATWCGVVAIVLTIVKFLLDSGEAGAATTAQEHEDESKEIGEDITALGVIAALAALLRGLGRVIKGLKGSTEDPANADPEALKKQADEAKESQSKATEDANKLKEAAAKKQGGGRKDMIDPNAPEVGELTIKNVPKTLPDGTPAMRVEVTASDGSFGHAERGYNPQTGEFQALEIDLGQIPKEARTVEVGGKPMPLSDYLTLRIMRLLEVPAATLRKMRIVEVEHIRSVIQLEKAAPGEPVGSTNPAVDAAARNIDSVTYNERALGEAGSGRITRAHVTGGTRGMLSDLLAKWEGEAPSEEMVKRHNDALTEAGLTRETAKKFEVRSGFDVELTIEPEPSGADPAGAGPETRIPVPVPQRDDRDAGTD